MNTDTVNLTCPICGNNHTYLLEVTRTPFLFGSKEFKTLQIKKLFTCLDTEEFFESILEIKEDNRGLITKVIVKGASK